MLKGKGGLLLFCSIPPAAPSVQLRSITSIMQHYRERGRCSLMLARKLNFHSTIIYSFFGGIFPAPVKTKSQKPWPLKTVWWTSPELETPEACSRTSSHLSNSRDLGCLKKQVEQLLCVQLPCGPQAWRIRLLGGKCGRRCWGACLGWVDLLCLQSKQPRGSLGFPWPHWRPAASQWDLLGPAYFYIAFSALTMLAFLGRQKLSCKMSDQL